MKQEIRQLLDLIKELDKMRDVYLSSYKLMSILRDKLRKNKYSLKDMVNFIYVMREISKFADDLRKEADGISHLFENMACAVWVTQGDGEPIRSALATGTPDVKLAIKIPSRKTQPEEYAKLMKHFEIPEQAITDKVVKLYWPGLCEHVSLLAEEGKPLPPGVDPNNTYPTYKVRIKPYANLDELTRDLEQAGRKEADAVREAACDELLTTRQQKNNQ